MLSIFNTSSLLIGLHLMNQLYTPFTDGFRFQLMLFTNNQKIFLKSLWDLELLVCSRLTS